MKLQDNPQNTRKNFFTTNFGKNQKVKTQFNKIFDDKQGNWAAIQSVLETDLNFTPQLIKDLKFTHNLAEWSKDNAKIVKTFQEDKETNSLRDLALKFDKKGLTTKLTNAEVAINIAETEKLATGLHLSLFNLQPTAFLHQMVSNVAETPVSNPVLSGNIATFLINQPEEFNIKTQSVYMAFQQEDAFKDIVPEVQEEVRTELMALQRVIAISPVPEVMPVLMKSKMTSAFRVAEMSEEQFIQTFSKDFGENGAAVAKALHTNAVNARIRNEQALMAMKEVGQGSGVAFIDQSLYSKKQQEVQATNRSVAATVVDYEKPAVYVAPQDILKERLQESNLSWDKLFGDADLCECAHCNSVYSPAAYFVDLLQYLRNNNIDTTKVKPDPKDISGTPLAHLFSRRPDLGCLQLTCNNTNTVLPYIDLVNEIMENYIVYHAPKAFNVEEETSGELLAQPQHIEYEAYCILHKAVYPFTLPYHQPIDVIRIFLNYLSSSRYELMDTYRSPRKDKIEPINDTEALPEVAPDAVMAALEEEEKAILEALHHQYLDRAVGAEYLGMTQEEYIILCKEAFVSKKYWDTQCKKEHTIEEYHTKINLKPVHKYYGYDTAEAMHSIDEGTKTGLTFVKNQFLPRTGIEYVDLVNLLKTQFLNPNMPEGEALALMESIGFSYRFLQTLVDNNAANPKAKYAELIEFLNTVQPFLPLLESILQPDPCNPKAVDLCLEKNDFEQWVYCYFESIGKIIVLENGCTCLDGILVHLNGTNLASVANNVEVIVERCIIYVYNRERDEQIKVGTIDKSTGIITLEDEFADEAEGINELHFIGKNGEQGVIIKGRLVNARTQLPFCVSQADNCDLDSVRLVHLDGTPLIEEKYDHIHRFIRLWRKLNWTIDEADKAIIGLGKTQKECLEDLLPGDENGRDCEDLFDDSGTCAEGINGEEGCFTAKKQKITCDITAALLHQLVAVKKLLDLTGLEVIKLLTIWTDISTKGEKSLYKRLFLRHNIQGMDAVFKADKNGYFLNNNAKITEHIPVLMAAFNLKADDIPAIISFAGLEDKLSLENISLIYRYRLLAKIIGEKIPTFLEVLDLFGAIFKDSQATLRFMENWLKMEDAGFSFRHLNYLIEEIDEERRPIKPTQKQVLQLAKTLYDGTNTIEENHKDIPVEEEVTIDMVRAKAAILFDQSIADKIIGLLEGTTIYRTNAPKALEITIPEDKPSLVEKLVYGKTAGTIQVTGILTEAETITFKALSNDPKWGEALIRIEKQQQKLFKEILLDIFEDQKKEETKKEKVELAQKILLSGDIKIPIEQIPEGQPDPNTAPQKQKQFLFVFLPFLRQRLTERFIVDTLSGLTGLETTTTSTLIFDILKVGTPVEPIYKTFEAIKYNPKLGELGWKGFLIPSATDTYTFVINNSDNAPILLLNGLLINFTRQEDPTNEWWSDGIELEAGTVYTFEVQGIKADLSDIRWKTTVSGLSALPSSALLPDYATEFTTEAFTLLKRIALAVDGFELSAEEIKHFHTYAANFDGLDFNDLSLKQWFRIEAYVRLRNSLSTTETNLLEFFQWTHQPDDVLLLSEKIAGLTLWEQKHIDKLIAENHFNLNNPESFHNEVNLLKLQKALKVADNIGMDIRQLFDWAKPTSNFKKTRQISEDIRKSVRALFKQEDWEQVVKPLNDQLRGNQKNALIAYLLVQPELIQWGVTDADGLFEYFLIDVQMEACMETSRIKQAISSTQLFIQRCFLGLEAPPVSNEVLDRGRWEWMQRYRVWEANRKVFLYPENWIESNLRDDKSPFFVELEGELLQKDINPQNVEDALKTYLYKVDEVADMEVVGLHIEGEKIDGDWKIGSKLHVFARTRNAPYFYYYRYLALDQSNWYPWEKIQIDIPNYDIENSEGEVTGNGCYLTPYVWNGRLLIFFPQIMPKTKPPAESAVNVPSDSDGDLTVPVNLPIRYYEIKMGWSEYRNRKWTQKQLSKEVLISGNSTTLPNIGLYEFVPVLDDSEKLLGIKVYHNDSFIKTFEFSGNSLGNPTKVYNTNNALTPQDFHHSNSPARIFSLQINSDVNNHYFNDETLTTYNTSIPFHHPSTQELLGEINTTNLESFFKYNSFPNQSAAYGGQSGSYHELKAAYSLYNWELFFHSPMMLGDALSSAQQFEQAMKWFHFVFNPMAGGTGANRFWQFSPFKEIDAQNILANIFNKLDPNTPNNEITEWRDNPFRPHLLARNRPIAYMKWVVMKYVDNLIEWGDYLFRQDTIESLNYATQLYVLSSHILGLKPNIIPKRGKIQPRTYLSLLDKWDAFSNAMVELEIAAPYSNQTALPIGIGNGVVGLANVFGFGTSLYFCIPNNPKLTAYWDTIADRLYKIRHCLNIEGVFRKLSLFEPPIDPALLVQATAQGLSIASVLNDLNAPMPNYRFYYLLQKAFEFCNELKSMGNAMLSALEKRDNEALTLLRAKHEVKMQSLQMEIRVQQLEEAKKSLESLQENRKAPEHRMRYYLQLIGEDVNKLPSIDGDFTELANSIEVPVDESGLKLIRFEKEDMDEASAAADWQTAIGITETLAGILSLIPTFAGDVKPFGVGAGIDYGGPQLGSGTSAVARGLQTHASRLTYNSVSAGKKGGFLRALQDRVMQANAAGYEIKQIDKQILTQQIRMEIVSQEITNQQQLIDNAAEVEDFLKNKYTNEELYVWMKGQLKSVYYQTYSLAYELAKKAEKVYRFEQGLSNSDFIQAGYWNSGRDGLLAGEQLYVGLKQLEAAYQEKRCHDYELTKHISLRQINPLALLQLRESGKCEFDLPEVLFDMDFPGHYKRRIKSVSISIPCVVGPYTSINASLRLLEHKYRNSNLAQNKNDYPEKIEAADERFSTHNIPITAIAVSAAQNESGLFELNFKDERYLPFEGAGAISKWRIELPSEFRQFDYHTINDCIIHLRYTSVEGGERLKLAANGFLQNFFKSVEELNQQEGIFTVIDLKHDLPNEWHKTFDTPLEDGASERTFDLAKIDSFLPYFVNYKEGQLRDRKDIEVTDVVLVAKTVIKPENLKLIQRDTEIIFTKGNQVGESEMFVIRDETLKLEKWKIITTDLVNLVENGWLILRMVVK